MKISKIRFVITLLLNLFMFGFSFLILIQSVGVSNIKTYLIILPTIFFLSTTILLLWKHGYLLFEKKNENQ